MELFCILEAIISIEQAHDQLTLHSPRWLGSQQEHPSCFYNFLFQTGRGGPASSFQTFQERLRCSLTCLHSLPPVVTAFRPFLLFGDASGPLRERRRDDILRWHRPERKEIPHQGGVSAESPSGVFVSDSGAWHISGRNSKVHAKIF